MVQLADTINTGLRTASVVPINHVADVLEAINEQIQKVMDETVGRNIAASTEHLLERSFVSAQVQAFRAHLVLGRSNGKPTQQTYEAYVTQVTDAVHDLLCDTRTSSYLSEYSVAYAREPKVALAMVRLAVTSSFAVVYPYFELPE